MEHNLHFFHFFDQKMRILAKIWKIQKKQGGSRENSHFLDPKKSNLLGTACKTHLPN